MNQDFNFDAQINLPDYIMGCVDKFDEESTTEKPEFKSDIFCENKIEKQVSMIPISNDCSLIKSETFTGAKRSNPIMEITQLKEDEEAIIDEVLESSSQNNQDSKQSNKNQKINKKKEIAKKYRQKKKEYIKSLQEENRYLRQKVDDLTFRLQQTENQMNRLKHGTSSYTSQFQSMKENTLKEVQQILSQQNLTIEQVNQVQARLQNTISFAGKQKIKTLNYFMSQLLQNAADNRAIYFLECFLSKRGIYRENKQVELSRMDFQMIQIFQSEGKETGEEFFHREVSQVLLTAGQKFKQCWQNIYLYYLKLLNEGFILDTMSQYLKQKIKTKIEMSIPLKVQLYFEKIKYRKDMRQLRETWFKQLETGSEIRDQIEKITSQKKVKV